MIRLCHISDIHFDERSFYWLHSERHPSVGTVVFNAIDDAARRGVDLFIFSGDMAGRETNHRYTAAEELVIAQMLIRAAQYAPVIKIKGNHTQAGEPSIFRYLGAQNSIIIADQEAQIVTLKNGLRIGCLPYQTIPELADMNLAPELRQAAALATLKPFTDGCDIVTAHFPAEGALIGGYEIASPNDVTLTRDWLSSFRARYVALGHIHAQQPIMPNAWYAGSPAPLTFGESGKKGYLYVEIELSDVQVTPVHLPSWEMVKLTVHHTHMPDAETWANAYVDLTVTVDAPEQARSIEKQMYEEIITRAGGTLLNFQISKPDLIRSRSAGIIKAETDEAKLRHALHEQSVEESTQDRIVNRFAELKAETPV